MSNYYKTIKIKNDFPFAYYLWQIKWIPEKIINDECINGYIVQKVKIIDEANVTGFDNTEYYEAWKVSNGECENEDGEPFDDEFKWVNFNGELRFCIRNSIGKTGKIIYQAKLYWISQKNVLYKEVDSWKKETVMTAGSSLKSIFAKDCLNIDFGIPIDERNFIHEVNFKDEKIIKNSIKEVFSILTEDKTLTEDIKLFIISSIKEELSELLECEEYNNYFNVIKEIIGE